MYAERMRISIDCHEYCCCVDYLLIVNFESFVISVAQMNDAVLIKPVGVLVHVHIFVHDLHVTCTRNNSTWHQRLTFWARCMYTC